MTSANGQFLDRYRILGQLGEGGMAVVYKAYDTSQDKEVAIKFLRAELLNKSNIERAIKRFALEVQALSRLDHPHIVKVYERGALVAEIPCESADDAADVVAQWEDVEGVKCELIDLAVNGLGLA